MLKSTRTGAFLAFAAMSAIPVAANADTSGLISSSSSSVGIQFVDLPATPQPSAIPGEFNIGTTIYRVLACDSNGVPTAMYVITGGVLAVPVELTPAQITALVNAWPPGTFPCPVQVQPPGGNTNSYR